MATLSAFTDMMGQFLGELVKTFPEEPAMKRYFTSFELMKKTNPRKILEVFIATVGPVQDKVMARDDSFFIDNPDMGFLDELNIKKHWTPELSDNTKNAIWQYLQTLYMLGSTISALPMETLGAIEKLAEQCAGEMESGGTLNQASLMQGLTGLLGSMGNGGLPGLDQNKKA